RTCRGDRSDQGRLAGIGKSDETDVGQQLQFEPQLVFLAGGASLEMRRHAIGGCRKMAVASPAFAAAGDGDGVSVRDQVRKEAARVEVVNCGPDRQEDFDGFSSTSGAIGSAPRFPVFRLVMALIPQVEKG